MQISFLVFDLFLTKLKPNESGGHVVFKQCGYRTCVNDYGLVTPVCSLVTKLVMFHYKPMVVLSNLAML